MVEANMHVKGNAPSNPESDVMFYEKFSGFQMLKHIQLVSGDKQKNHDGAPKNYPIILEQNKMFKEEMMVGCTNQKVYTMNLESGQLVQLDGECHSV